MSRQRGAAGNSGEMTFEEIGRRLGIHRQAAERYYRTGMRKLRKSAAVLDALQELSEYHHQLRAKSAECIAAREHW